MQLGLLHLEGVLQGGQRRGELLLRGHSLRCELGLDGSLWLLQLRLHLLE